MTAGLAGRRDPYLDGIRGVFCATLVGYHVTAEILFSHGPPTVAPLSLAWVASTWGPGLIDTFFVLSGFFITRILVEHRDSGSYFRTFWLRRAARILPTAYAVLFAFGVALPWLRPFPPGSLVEMSTSRLWPHWTLTTNLAQAAGHDFGFFGPYWSISLEEQFYLLWPMAVYALSRRRLQHLCVALLVVAPVMRYALAASPFANYPLVENQLFTRTDGFAAGALIALLEDDGRRVPSGWAAAIGAVLLIAALPDGGTWVQHRATPYWSALMHSGMVALSVALVASRDALGRGILGLLFANRVSATYGRWSYGVYLVHFPMLHLMFRTVARHQPANDVLTSLYWMGFAVGMVLLSGAVAAILHYTVERPGLSLYRYLPFAPPKTVPGAEALRRSRQSSAA